MEKKSIIKNWLGFLLFLASYVVARWALQRFILPEAPPCGWDALTVVLGAFAFLALVLVLITNEKSGSYWLSLWLASLTAAGIAFWNIPEALEITRYALYGYTAIYFLVFVWLLISWAKSHVGKDESFLSKALVLIGQSFLTFAVVGVAELIL